MGSRKIQDLLSTLGASRPWGKGEGWSKEAGKGAEKSEQLNKNQ